MPTRKRTRETEVDNEVIVTDKPKRNGSTAEEKTILPLHVEASRIAELYASGALTIGELELLTGSWEPSQTSDAVRLTAHFIYVDGHYLDPIEAKRMIRPLSANQLERIVRELGAAIALAAVPLESETDS